MKKGEYNAFRVYYVITCYENCSHDRFGDCVAIINKRKVRTRALDTTFCLFVQRNL
jgi:hypothetical protein